MGYLKSLACRVQALMVRFLLDLRGVSTVEYALIVVAVIAIVAVAAGLLGDAFETTFEDLSERMTDAGDVVSNAAT